MQPWIHSFTLNTRLLTITPWGSPDHLRAHIRLASLREAWSQLAQEQGGKGLKKGSVSLIFGFWVGFKPTFLFQPAQWSQNSLRESSGHFDFVSWSWNWFLSLTLFSSVSHPVYFVHGQNGRKQGRKEKKGTLWSSRTLWKKCTMTKGRDNKTKGTRVFCFIPICLPLLLLLF